MSLDFYGMLKNPTNMKETLRRQNAVAIFREVPLVRL
jgi:hypothetical protein